ncbi:Trypsin-like peptidase domain-containing protein [Pelagirhabdus alkalitolerans]|uniref:Trypsin-like peptidase domain-containing protein n=1 Tax=Pelagirhabdus alkalitolerans TaxID=1612202 RepID=A0A1G6GZ75_9BACI|nr:S1C family serine protease [Pelagirhabdus alkalitolerans]SDB86985.1 Trypsin-like peptidase domain-containing protein [Pelagirhabdus alkalitolerans]
MKNKKSISITLFTLVVLLIGISLNFSLYNGLFNQTLNAEYQILEIEEERSSTDDLQHIIHEVQKSVVQLNVSTPYTDRVGSGFIYNSRGDIITNAHVIEDAESINVTLTNTETYPAAIVKVGEEKDIAVIRVPQLMNHQPIQLEENEHLVPGEEIIAVGSPLGFQNTVTLGIISGIDRSFEIDEFNYENVYQISANITHGNSGGPLIDRRTGRVIGVNSAGIEESDIGFSIPIPAIIEDVKNWSSTTSNDELTFPSEIRPTTTNQEALVEDAQYLIEYFAESITMNDYLNAYALLGSDKQNNTDYPSFRSRYLDILTFDIIELTEDETSSHTVTINASIELNKTNETNQTEVVDYTFTVGYENDQLRILDYDQH